jgi:hypothetical protein
MPLAVGDHLQGRTNHGNSRNQCFANSAMLANRKDDDDDEETIPTIRNTVLNEKVE